MFCHIYSSIYIDETRISDHRPRHSQPVCGGTAGAITAGGGKHRGQSRRDWFEPARRSWDGCHSQLKEKGMLVAADMQGYVRVLRGHELKYEPWPEMHATLPRWIYSKAMPSKRNSSPARTIFTKLRNSPIWDPRKSC